LRHNLDIAHFKKPKKFSNVGYDAGSCVLEQLANESNEEEESDEIATMHWKLKYYEYIPWAKNKSIEEEWRNLTSIS
jgi:hypothetical protein